MEIKLDNTFDSKVQHLLNEHLQDMYATSPKDSVHAFDLKKLQGDDIAFYTCRENNQLLGCAALKILNSQQAELKSMRTASNTRNKGVASSLLKRIITHAREHHISEVLLETGSMDYFLPARNLYLKFGFQLCEPFADYQPDPNSVFMMLSLE